MDRLVRIYIVFSVNLGKEIVVSGLSIKEHHASVAVHLDNQATIEDMIIEKTKGVGHDHRCWVDQSGTKLNKNRAPKVNASDHFWQEFYSSIRHLHVFLRVE